MRKKWIGPPNPGADGQEQGHDVLVNGRLIARGVKPGEVVDIPDDLVTPTKDWPGVQFPEPLWEDAPAEAAAKALKKKDGDA
jgi:hypothetical protein